MSQGTNLSDPSTWDPELDAVKAAPKHHKFIFENERVRVLEVTLELGARGGDGAVVSFGPDQAPDRRHFPRR